MAFDAHTNGAYSTVLTAPSPASSGTSLVVQSSDGTRFPAVPFNATVWPAGAQPLFANGANAEIVRVTAISTDTFTITRTVEGTSARSIVVGDQIMAGITKKTTYDIEGGNNGLFDYVVSGCVWTGDSLGSTRAASMTAGTVWLNKVQLSVAAVTSRTFTASKDTYIDLTDNGDGTAAFTYVEVTNNAASPALTSNGVRIGIIITGASSIAAAGSINQGQETMVLPIASSIPYSVTDSLGNLICPRDVSRKLLGYRQRASSDFTTTNTSATQITELSCPVIVPTARKVKVTIICGQYYNTVNNNCYMTIWDGTVGSGTQLQRGGNLGATAVGSSPANIEAITTPGSSSKTYNAGLHVAASGTAHFETSSTEPGYIKVELV